MKEETKIRAARGVLVGTTTINGVNANIYVDKCNFGLQQSGQFIKHISAATLRQIGIYSLSNHTQ